MILRAISKMIFVCGVILTQSWASPATLTGLWETVDDYTGKKKAIVHIYQKKQTFYADIVKVYWQGNEQRICKACQDKKRHLQPIEGLNVLWGLKAHSAMLWDKGYIIDPSNGQIYHVRIKKNNELLYVRAYIGIPLLGRTQIWHRYQA